MADGNGDAFDDAIGEEQDGAGHEERDCSDEKDTAVGEVGRDLFLGGNPIGGESGEFVVAGLVLGEERIHFGDADFAGGFVVPGEEGGNVFGFGDGKPLLAGGIGFVAEDIFDWAGGKSLVVVLLRILEGLVLLAEEGDILLRFRGIG